MSMMYVAPEQQMKDRADFARKGIARGRSVVVLRYADGICFVAENRSQALHKVSEIYDRIGFAAVGRYNEFENLRIAGIRHADLRGYSYDRQDVTGRGLANAYAQLLGTIFSAGGEKPYEVEIAVAELGAGPADDQIYRLTYDGSVADEERFAVMGGQAEAISSTIAAGFRDDLDLAGAVALAVEGLEGAHRKDSGGLDVDALEVAVLDRNRMQPRKFRRIAPVELRALLAVRPGDDEASRDDAAGTAEQEPAQAVTDRDTTDRDVTDRDATDSGPADEGRGTGETSADDSPES